MKCLNCSNEFEPRRIDQLYCSVRCKEASHKKRRYIKRREAGLPSNRGLLEAKSKALKEVGRREMCVFCGRENALNIHERDFNQANTKASNLVYLCAGCHFILHNYVLIK